LNLLVALQNLSSGFETSSSYKGRMRARARSKTRVRALAVVTVPQVTFEFVDRYWEVHIATLSYSHSSGSMAFKFPIEKLKYF
jgi:hypothetical protein